MVVAGATVGGMKIIATVSLVALLGCGFVLAVTSASVAGTTRTSAPRPLHSCDFTPGLARLCPTVLLAKTRAVIDKGTTVTFRGRVADPSKNFLYRISVTRGDIRTGAGEEITNTYRSHKAVVYPSRRWKADVTGVHTACVVGSHMGAPITVAHDCRTFTVR
jgi:hypothetical protein